MTANKKYQALKWATIILAVILALGICGAVVSLINHKDNNVVNKEDTVNWGDANLPKYTDTQALKLEAEEADLAGCGLQDGFVNDIVSGSMIRFTFNCTSNCSAEIYLSVAGQLDNGTTVTKALAVYINGSKEAIYLDVGTKGWVNFTELLVGQAALKKGLNTIEIRGVESNGKVNVDYLQISPVN